MLDELLSAVPDHLHQAYLQLLSRIPGYTRHLAIIGNGCGALGYLLKKRPDVTVTGIVFDARYAPVARELLDAVHIASEGFHPLPEGPLDAVLLCDLERGVEASVQCVAQLGDSLHANTHIFALHGDPGRRLPAAYPHGEALEGDLASALAQQGFHVYTRWPLVDETRPDAPTDGSLLMAVHRAYNPVLHAGEFRANGDPANAYTVLEFLPPAYLENPATRETVELEKLATLRDWIAREKDSDPSHLLNRAQQLFYARVDAAPRQADAYQIMADCWVHAGNANMACRLLRSIQTAAPTGPVAACIERLTVGAAPSLSVDDVPPWNASAPLRVLILIHPRPHFGLDTLFDGLCDCLGDENVVDYPWKGTLHGQASEHHVNYPCRFDRAGVARSLETVVRDLQAGAFDLILYGDVEGALSREDLLAIMAVRGNRPVYLVDALDEMGNFRQLAAGHLGIPDFAACFKREMVGSIDYGPRCFPLPFSYSPPASAPRAGQERGEPFFWAGHRMFGQRRLYLDALEARHGWNLEQKFSQAEYRERLQTSRIGLNCFGMGFDTVRYWELPAHGCMMLSDRLPIRIPFNFQDGVHAVFFDDLADLLEKTDYYLAHPEEAAAIGEAGYAHFMAHHTNRARASQLLGWTAHVQASA